MTALKKYSILVGIGLALVAGGYAVGRYAAPDKVVVTKEIVTVHDVQTVKVVDQQAILDAISKLNVQKNVHKVTTKVKNKDGTVTTTTTTDDHSTSQTQVQTETKTNTKATDTTHTVDTQIKLTTKTVERERPAWRLSLQPGLDYPYLLGKTGPGYNLLPSRDLLQYVVVGVALEHRLVGPFSGGIWANTRGAGGLVLSVEW